VERNVRDLGDPGDSWATGERGASRQGIRIMSNERGNPETEVGRTLNVDERTRTNEGQVGRTARKGEGRPKIARESDQLIVLRDGRADHKGKGLAGSRSPQRKPCPDMECRNSKANLTAGNSGGVSEGAFAESRLSEEPGAGKPHAGIRGGAAGKLAVLPR